MSETDKLYVAKIETVAYTFFLAAREEQLLYDACTTYARWELMSFLDNCDGYDQTPEQILQKATDILISSGEAGDWRTISKFLNAFYDLFRFSFHIVHLDEVAQRLFVVENFHFQEEAPNEYIPKVIYQTRKEYVDTLIARNISPKFYTSEATIVTDPSSLRFEVRSDGEMHVSPW